MVSDDTTCCSWVADGEASCTGDVVGELPAVADLCWPWTEVVVGSLVWSAASYMVFEILLSMHESGEGVVTGAMETPMVEVPMDAVAKQVVYSCRDTMAAESVSVNALHCTDSNGCEVENWSGGAPSVGGEEYRAAKSCMVYNAFDRCSDLMAKGAVGGCVAGEPRGSAHAVFDVQCIDVQQQSCNTSPSGMVCTVMRFQPETHVDDAKRLYGVIAGQTDLEVTSHTCQWGPSEVQVWRPQTEGPAGDTACCRGTELSRDVSTEVAVVKTERTQ